MIKDKKGFTLAEVLITIAVLGIVAAVTIYVIVNVIPEEHVYTSKKASVTLSNGVQTLLNDVRIYPNKKFEGGKTFCLNYAKLFKNSQSSNCNINADFSNLNLANGQRLNDSFYDKTNITTSSGEVWMGINQTFKDEKTPIKILVDVNGKNKGDNILGQDVVLLSLYQNGKIGEFGDMSTSTAMQTPSGVDCKKCKFEKKVSESCSAAYKGKLKMVCSASPICSYDSGDYACCAYILAHSSQFSWGPWTSSGRSTKDDLGRTCFQNCESLTKFPGKVTATCGDGVRWKTKHDTYYLNGQEIVKCRKNKKTQPCTCKAEKKLNYTIVIGDLSKDLSADRDWIMGQANYAATCTRGTGLRNCCGKQAVSKSDLKIPKTAKITKCECTNIRSVDFGPERKDSDIGGTFKCDCKGTDDGISVNLCTRFRHSGNYVTDYDDWGVSSFYVEYESDDCN